MSGAAMPPVARRFRSAATRGRGSAAPRAPGAAGAACPRRGVGPRPVPSGPRACASGTRGTPTPRRRRAPRPRRRAPGSRRRRRRGRRRARRPRGRWRWRAPPRSDRGPARAASPRARRWAARRGRARPRARSRRAPARGRARANRRSRRCAPPRPDRVAVARLRLAQPAVGHQHLGKADVAGARSDPGRERQIVGRRRRRRTARFGPARPRGEARSTRLAAPGAVKRSACSSVAASASGFPRIDCKVARSNQSPRLPGASFTAARSCPSAWARRAGRSPLLASAAAAARSENLANLSGDQHPRLGPQSGRAALVDPRRLGPERPFGRPRSRRRRQDQARPPRPGS